MLQNMRDLFSNWRSDSALIVTSTARLSANQQVIVIKNGEYTITLPKVAEAAGKLYSFVQVDSGTNDVTITDATDDPAWTDVIIDAQYEKATIYSDGVCWHLLEGATS